MHSSLLLFSKPALKGELGVLCGVFFFFLFIFLRPGFILVTSTGLYRRKPGRSESADAGPIWVLFCSLLSQFTITERLSK